MTAWYPTRFADTGDHLRSASRVTGRRRRAALMLCQDSTRSGPSCWFALAGDRHDVKVHARTGIHVASRWLDQDTCRMSIEIGLPTLLGILLLPAVTFALAYSWIVTHLSRSLISPYSKADVVKRFNAAMVDGLVVITLCLPYWMASSPLYLAASAGYLLLRDAIGGQSIGKLLFGLVAINLMTGRAASISQSARRNALLLLPGANLFAIFLEARTIATDPLGQRLGDRLAHTQVVEGAGARDLVKSLQDWLLNLGRGLGPAPGGRRRVPGRIDRAA